MLAKISATILNNCLAVCIAASITACGPFPQPFRPPPGKISANPLLQVVSGAGVTVLPVAGLATTTMSRRLTVAVAQALLEKDIVAVATPVPTRLGYELYGRILNQTTVLDLIQIEMEWILRDRAHQVIGSYVTPIHVSAVGFAEEEDSAVQSMAKEIVSVITRSIRPQLEQVKQNLQQSQSSPPSVRFSVTPVQGASGDGESSLQLAMLKTLVDLGLERDSEDPQALLEGSVIIRTYDAYQQYVEITWRIIGSDGNELGVVRLDNLVPTGSLDGRWGAVAFAIAAASGNGILQVLGQQL